MKEALFYKKLKDKNVQCMLCPRKCVIAQGKRGFCRVRENKDGKLFSVVYARPCTEAVDPIEKKPLFHFLPGSMAYSIATPGCNLACKHCQNWSISQVMPEEVPCHEAKPEDVVERALQADCESISYTYIEPTIFYEYILDIAKLARKKGLKNTMVTNGFINQEPLKELYKYIDAANIDLKGFTEEFYKNVCSAQLKPVLEAIKTMKKMNVWIEITNLIIPTLNDDMNKIKEMCEWIVKNLGNDVPLHFSRFFPYYKLMHLPPTPIETLTKAYDIAVKTGIKYVYVGNIITDKYENTHCPKCKKLLIERTAFFVKQNNIENNKCKFCKEKIAGVF